MLTIAKATPEMIQHIVIVGGGAGGLELATRLGHSLGRTNKAIITLVDRYLTHLWKPLLHEVAAGTLDLHENTLNYLHHAVKHGYHFQPGNVVGIDRKTRQLHIAAYPDNKQVTIPPRTLFYDSLIFAVGAQINDFQVPGVHEHCAFLDNALQAEAFHQRLLACIFQAQYQQKPIRLAIVGGGATGVELAAELQYSLHRLNRFRFSQLEKQGIHIILFEAGERLLTALPERIACSTTQELKHLGIQVCTQTQIIEVTARGVHLANDKFITADIVVWAAGIKAAPFLSRLGLATNVLHQLIVQPTLQTNDDERIFAIGDFAAVPQSGDKHRVPALAQAAHQEATLLAISLKRYLQGKPLLPFDFHYHGALISLSRYSAIGYLMGRLPGRWIIEGRIARFFYLLLYKSHQMVIIGFWRTIILTIANVLTHSIKPHLKLH